MSCIICNNKNLKLVKVSVRDCQDVNVEMCDNCRHQQLNPLPSTDDLQEFYDQDTQAKLIYENIDVEEARRRSQFDVVRRSKLVQSFIQNKETARVLEIGTGYGFFIKEMKNEGYDIEGIEISEARRNIARSLTKNTIYGYDLVKEMPEELIGKYDIIVMFQVLEHILDPGLFLDKIRKMLKEEGIVIIEVPNLDDHLLGISKDYFDFFYQIAHLSYFSPKSLGSLLNQCHYRNIEIYGSQRYSVQNMMNWLLNKKPQLYNPVYEGETDLKWLEDYYKNELADKLKTDTIIAIAYK